MKDYLLLLVSGTALLHAACAKPPSQNLMLSSDVPALQKVEHLANADSKVSSKQPIKTKQPIDREQAIAIASEDVVKNGQPLEVFKVSTCEKRFLWVIIYDGGGFEYFVSKRSGEILGVRKVLHAFDDASRVAQSNSNEEGGVNKTEAIAIAKRDFLELYGDVVNRYDPVVCELTYSWRIFFEHKLEPGQNPSTLPTSDTPDYVIDKKTGKIIYRQKY